MRIDEKSNLQQIGGLTEKRDESPDLKSALSSREITIKRSDVARTKEGEILKSYFRFVLKFKS